MKKKRDMLIFVVFGVREGSPVSPGHRRRLPEDFWKIVFFSACFNFFDFFKISDPSMCNVYFFQFHLALLISGLKTAGSRVPSLNVQRILRLQILLLLLLLLLLVILLRQLLLLLLLLPLLN